jgi:hypothetical protein
LAILVGCATKYAGQSEPPPKNDIAECREIVSESLVAVRTTLRTVNEIGALTNSCPSRLFNQLAQNVHQLNVDSLKVRARAQAMQARGAAYFEQWRTNLSRAEDPAVRQRADELRASLQETFQTIHSLSQPTREAFRPFLKAVRKLRNELDNDPANLHNDSTKELVQSADENGRKVEQGLASIIEELSQAAALLNPGQTAAN